MTSGGKWLAKPAFPGDDGSPDLALRAQFASPTAVLVQQLQTTRLLVAVVTVRNEVQEEATDKSSHLATVSMINAAGQKGLLAFTGVDSLTKWDPAARPVPVLGAEAAQSALDDGAKALVIDVAGPHRYVVTGPALLELAAGANQSNSTFPTDGTPAGY